MPDLTNNNRVYIMESDFGIIGRAFVETDAGNDLETLIADLMSGDYNGSVKRVIAVDVDVADVSVDLAGELVRRAWRAGVDLPKDVRDFCSEQGISLPPTIDEEIST